MPNEDSDDDFESVKDDDEDEEEDEDADEDVSNKDEESKTLPFDESTEERRHRLSSAERCPPEFERFHAGGEHFVSFCKWFFLV